MRLILQRQARFCSAQVILAIGFLGLYGCEKVDDLAGVQSAVWETNLTEVPGVSFSLVVSGDHLGHPMIVMIGRDEQSDHLSSNRPKWEARGVGVNGVHEFYVQGRQYAYSGSPILLVWSAKDKIMEFKQSGVPVDWLSRFSKDSVWEERRGSSWTREDFQSFWKQHALPILTQKPNVGSPDKTPNQSPTVPGK